MGSWYLHRTACKALEEMRDAYRTRNFSYLLGLIEELQSMVNRMEAGLDTKRDLTDLQAEVKKLRHEKRKLKEQIEETENSYPEA